MTVDEYEEALATLPFGKRLPEAVYIYRFSGYRLHPTLRKLIDDCAYWYDISRRYNVIKLYKSQPCVTFLCYPTFLTEAHPALVAAVHVKLDKKDLGKVETDYSKYKNPPILHRKECMLPERFRGRDEMIAMTKAEEALGLYENTSAIGTRDGWNKLLNEKGVYHEGHRVKKRRELLVT